jgi:siroheme decarboxylase
MSDSASKSEGYVLDEVDRQIIVHTQAGLPLSLRPYDCVAALVGIAAEEVMTRMRNMQTRGVIRRIGAVPNHYKLGYTANGMSVWDVTPGCIDEMGEMIGRLDFVSHAYHRPRFGPQWPYNLFAMVHGRSRGEVEAKVAHIAQMLGDACQGHTILYSTRILKKTGLRIQG